MAKSEQQIQKEIINYLESLGAWTCKVIQANKRGVSDILACLNGQFIAVEVKKKGKLSTVSMIQQHQLTQIQLAMGVSILTDDLEKFKEILQSSCNNLNN